MVLCYANHSWNNTRNHKGINKEKYHLEIKEDLTESRNHPTLVDIAHLIEIIFHNYLIT